MARLDLLEKWCYIESGNTRGEFPTSTEKPRVRAWFFLCMEVLFLQEEVDIVLLVAVEGPCITTGIGVEPRRYRKHPTTRSDVFLLFLCGNLFPPTFAFWLCRFENVDTLF